MGTLGTNGLKHDLIAHVKSVKMKSEKIKSAKAKCKKMKSGWKNDAGEMKSWKVKSVK